MSVASQRFGPLLVSRSFEQGVIGVGSLLLARAVGLDDFAPISVLLIVNSLSLTLSDFGLGTDALRLEEGRLASRSELMAVRRRNLAVVVVTAAVGAALGGSAGVVLVAGGCVWATSAESFIRRSAALRRGAVASVVRAEIAGGLVLAAGIGLACTWEASALQVFGAALVAKQLVEIAMVREWRPQFGPVPPVPDTRVLWVAQAVAYAVANADFVVLGLAQSEQAFSIYVLAFRLANALPSQLSYVAGRVLSTDFALADRHELQRMYDRSTRVLFLLAIGGAVVIAALAPALPSLLGDDWTPITWVLITLACSLPSRMAIGIAGTMAVALRRSTPLLQLEVAHLVLLVGACAIAAAAGMQPFVIVVSSSTVVASLAYHELAGRLGRIRPWRPLLGAAIVSLVLIALAGAQIIDV